MKVISQFNVPTTLLPRKEPSIPIERRLDGAKTAPCVWEKRISCLYRKSKNCNSSRCSLIEQKGYNIFCSYVGPIGNSFPFRKLCLCLYNLYKGHYLPRFFCLCLFPFLSHVLVRLFSCLLPGFQSRQKQEISISFKMSISTLQPNQPPLQGFFTGLKRPGEKLSSHPRLVSVDSG